MSKSLIDYNQTRKLPNFPTHYTDEVGLLMSNISKQFTFQLLICNRDNLLKMYNEFSEGV